MTRRILAIDVAVFVAKRHGLRFDDFLAENRKKAVARPRQIAMYCIHHLCPHLSYPTIARVLGRKDHTTIMHGVRRIADLMPSSPRITAEVGQTLSHFRDSEGALDAQIAQAVTHLGGLIEERQAVRAAA